MRKVIDERRQAEEGATATTFLVVLFVLLGMTMTAIDGGSLLVSRRGQIADTDAAALAAAQRMIECPGDPTGEAAAEAQEYATKNDPTTSVIDFDPTTAETDVELTITATSAGGCPLSGIVGVNTLRQAPLFFAPAFGFDSVSTDTGSYAIFGEVEEARGLRPMGICISEPHYDLLWQEYLEFSRGIPNDEADPDEAGEGWTGWAAAKAAVIAAYEEQRPGLFWDLGANKVYDEGVDLPLATPFDLFPTMDSGGTLYHIPPPLPPDAANTQPRVHRIPFNVEGSKDDLDFCGEGPSGNFDWLDFDGSPSDGAEVDEDCSGVGGGQELNCDVANGFQGLIDLDSSVSGTPDCDLSATNPDGEDVCASAGGEVSAADEGLANIVCPSGAVPASDCETIFIIVYAGFADPAEFRLVTAIGLVLRDYNTSSVLPGDPKNPNSNYLDIEFVDELLVGKIGPADPEATGPLGVSLCGSDASFDDRNCNYGP